MGRAVRKKRHEKRKRHLARLKAKVKRLQAFADKLNESLPKSEIWFQDLYKPYQSSTDKFNTPFASFIPDVLNETYKYIIEVDGSIHELKHIKIKDLKKDKKFRSLGFDVVRIKAFDMESFQQGMERIKKLKGPYYTPGRTFTETELRDIKNKYNAG